MAKREEEEGKVGSFMIDALIVYECMCGLLSVPSSQQLILEFELPGCSRVQSHCVLSVLLRRLPGDPYHS